MYVHKGWDHCIIKPRVYGRLDKRMLELATIGLYGQDGEWLNCLATISNFVTTDTRPGNSVVFVFSLWQASVNCIVLQEYVWTVSWQKHCSDFRW